MMKFLELKSSAGDTIVEVMMAIALIGSAIALTLGMSHHSLNTDIDSVQRSQALSVAQGQIERIRNAYNANPSLLSGYKGNKPFCILDDATVALVSAPGSKCINFDNTPFTISVTYDKKALSFTVNASWTTNANGSGQDNLTLYYKLPG